MSDAAFAPETDAGLPRPHRDRVAASRASILAAFGGGGRVHLLRFPGNIGDSLIHAGTRRLLEPLRPTEVGFARALGGGADILAIAGGGAWSRVYHELLPALLPTFERLYGRVVVLPSSFEPEVPAVHRALDGSRAIVFAREAESWSRIKDLCDARLALDGAFFFDVRGFRRDGEGELFALRRDAEALDPWAPGPAGNRDLSAECLDLDEWLTAIAGAGSVLTDRCHVLIAAALLGKPVRYRSSGYHKLPAIAAYALGDFPRVRPAEEPPASRIAVATPAASSAVPAREALLRRARAHPPPSGGASGGGGAPRVTAGILVSDRPEVERCLASLREIAIPYHLLLVDRTCRPGRLEEYARRAAALPAASCRVLPPGAASTTASGRRDIADQATTEYVFFLDDDAEIFPGTLEWLLDAMDRHPEAAASTAMVMLPDGRVQIFGGEIVDQGELLLFTAGGHGLEPAATVAEDPPALAGGATGWLGGACSLVRRRWLLAEPLDLRLAAYYEDNEWCYRVARAGGRFLRVPESLCLHHQRDKGRAGSGLAEILRIQPYVDAVVAFHGRHGRILGGLYDFVPELRRPDGRPDIERTRLFVELSAARGSAWRLERWLSGGLDAILGRPSEAPIEDGAAGVALRAARAECAAALVAQAAAGEEATRLRHALQAAGAQAAAAHDVLAELQRSRLWKFADAYWRLRRRAAGRS